MAKNIDSDKKDKIEKQVCDFYLNCGKSLNKTAEEFNKLGFYPEKIKKVLKANNITIKKQIEYSDVVVELKNKGIGKEEIKKLYIDDGLSQKSLAEYIEKQINIVVGEKLISSLLKNWGIKKTPEQIKRAKGNKSRAEKAHSFSMLKQAGFNSAKELAEFYENKGDMTYSGICKMLNDKIGKEVFTERWLGRHMAKELSPEHLREKGTSFAEKSLVKYIKEIYNKDIKTNVYGVITPYELDILLPDINMAIEFNGTYFHSDNFMLTNHKKTSYNYHLNKFEMCAERNIQLLFVWEDDWEDYRDEIEKALISSINKGIIDPRLLKLD